MILLALLCLEINFELMTGQHMILILLEMNVLVVLMSSILRFKGMLSIHACLNIDFFLTKVLMLDGFTTPAPHSVLLVKSS